MLWFAKLAAASSGRLIRAYFTENSPDRAPGEELKPDGSGRLTAYYTGRDSRATWRADMPFAVSRALGIDPTRPPTNEALDRLFEAKRADSGEKWSKQHRKISAFDFQTAPHKSVTLAAEFAEAPAEAAAIWHAMDRANDATMAEIQRLEADLTQSQECLAQSQKYAQWAGPEIERLRAHVTRLTARVREFEAGAEAERVAVLDNVRRILGGDDDLPLG